jgi:molybdenum cofactor cytidylyltransferase
MKFHPLPLANAVGHILGHNIAGEDGRRLLRKGQPLTAEGVALLQQLGRATVYVAELEAGDVPENTAAERVATAVAGDNLIRSKAITGRCNLHSPILGLLRVDEQRLHQLNLCEGVTLGTLPNHSVVRPRQMVATLKIIAYALGEAIVQEAETVGRMAGGETRPLLHIDPLPPRRVGLILSGSPSAQARITDSFRKALQARLHTWGAHLAQIDFVPLEDLHGEVALADLLGQQVADGMEMIILAGETAIMDRHDIAPRAVERAGGRVACFGAPVDPGNLLMLAWHGGVPIVGAPGCARSPKQNIIDLIIPRLLAGDYLSKMDIVKLAHGGLLEDVPERGRPRKLS